MRKVDALLQWIGRRPGRAMMLFALIAAAIVPFAARVKIDRSTSAFWLHDDPEVALLERIKERFGSDDILAAAFDVPDPFAPTFLKALHTLIADLERFPHVQQVKSVTNGLFVGNEGQDVVVRKLFDPVPDDPREVARRRDLLLQDPLFRRNLVSEDGKVTGLFLFFDSQAAENDKHVVTGKIVARVNELRSHGKVHIAGTPYLKWDISRTSIRSLAILMPVLLFASGIVFFLLTRSWRLALVPVLTNLAALAMTLGFTGMMGHHLNPFTTASLIFTLVLATSYVMHAVLAVLQALGATPIEPAARERAFIEGLRALRSPLFLALLTTGVGFFSTVTNEIDAVKYFGMILGSAIVAIYLCTHGLALPLAYVLVRRRDIHTRRLQIPRFLGIWVQWFVRQNRALVFGFLAVVLGLAIWGTTRVTVISNSLSWFKQDAPARVSERFVRERMYPTATLNLVVEHPSQSIFEPALLRALEELQGEIAAHAKTAGVISIVSYLRQLHKAFNGGKQEFYRVPETAAKAEQLLLLFEDPKTIGRFLDEPRRSVRFFVRTYERDSGPFLAYRQAIQELAEKRLAPLGAKVFATSTLALVSRSFDNIAKSMIQSVLISLGVILLLFFAKLRNLFLLLRFFLPNAIPIVVLFGGIGFIGTPLDYALASVCCAILGIAVDDTIHLFEEFELRFQEGLRGDELLTSVINTKGWGVLLSSTILMAGLAVFNVVPLKWLNYLGTFVCLGLGVCLVFDLFLTPLLLSSYYRRKERALSREMSGEVEESRATG